MRVYLAGPYRHRGRLLSYSRFFEARGHAVTSHWLFGTHDLPKNMEADAEKYDSILAAIAEEDVIDIADADALVIFPIEAEQVRRGGHHVELGIAIGLGKHIVAVGGIKPNIFYRLPEIQTVGSVEEALDLLDSLTTKGQEALPQTALLEERA